MDKIPIPADDVVALDEIANNVRGLRLLIVNVYALSNGRNWVLVDAGLRYTEGRIRRWTEEQFSGQEPGAILLTHGHFDHTGALGELAEEWDVPVYVHPLEAPYVTGVAKYPPPDPSVGGGLMAMLSRLYPRGPVDVSGRVRTLPLDGSVPELPGWRWIHTPGHTEGHVSFFREEDRVLVAGDAFVTTKQESFLAAMTQRPELHGPPAYFTTNWDLARNSVVELAALRPWAAATGHGRPIVGPEVADALQMLADQFDRVARPEHGEYVDSPAA